MKIRFKTLLAFFIIQVSSGVIHVFAQEEIDVVDPYQMKISRSKEADTFYFSESAKKAGLKHRIDTLKTYDVFLEERPTPFGKAYMCNGSEVTKEKFSEYKLLWNAAAACKPCMLYTYDDKDRIKHIAYQYQDCLCGHYVEYYPEGTKKLEGQFKENTSGNWQNLKSRDICNIRDGVWTYYYPNGVFEKTETFVEGKLKETSGVNNSATAKKDMDAQPGEDETQPKKGFIQKMKSKNKTSN